VSRRRARLIRADTAGLDGTGPFSRTSTIPQTPNPPTRTNLPQPCRDADPATENVGRRAYRYIELPFDTVQRRS